jgi:uncharacterized protein with FMN-binding domain
MKKILLSLLVIFTFAGYAIFSRNDDDKVNTLTLPQSVSNNEPLPTDNPNPISINSISGSFKDGEYKGDIADAFYGNIEVAATIQNSKITDVKFLQYPNDRPTSVEINQQAMPLLKQEAIQSQNANVDIISGATQTSEAFRVSLQSALSQAQ